MISNILSQIPKNWPWKKIGIGAAILILLAGVFWAGRSSVKESVKIVTVDKVTETTHEVKTVTQQIDFTALYKKIEQLSTSINRLDEVSKSTLKTVTTITKPDGTIVKKEVTDTDLNRKTSTQENSSKTSNTSNDTKVAAKTDSTAVKDTAKTEEHTKIVEKLVLADNWRVTAQLGYGLPSLWRDVPSYVPGLPQGFVVGAAVERKLFLGINGGIWLNSRLDGGLQLSKGF